MISKKILQQTNIIVYQVFTLEDAENILQGASGRGKPEGYSEVVEELKRSKYSNI